MSENEVSHECETPQGKVSVIKDKFEGFVQNKNKNKRKTEYGKKTSKEKKEKMRKEKCVRKVRKHLHFCAKQSDHCI